MGVELHHGSIELRFSCAKNLVAQGLSYTEFIYTRVLIQWDSQFALRIYNYVNRQ